MSSVRMVKDAGSTKVEGWRLDFEGLLIEGRRPSFEKLFTLSLDLSTTGFEDVIQNTVQETYSPGDDRSIEKILQGVTLERHYAEYAERIKSFAYLRSDWNPYGAAPPNSEAINKALRTLAIMRDSGILPDLVNPSVEEGIVFEWKVDDKFFLFEFYNDGEVIYLKREGDEESHVFEIDLDEIPLIIREVANA